MNREEFIKMFGLSDDEYSLFCQGLTLWVETSLENGNIPELFPLFYNRSILSPSELEIFEYHQPDQPNNRELIEYIAQYYALSNMQVIDVEGDGNCFFRAVAEVLHHDNALLSGEEYRLLHLDDQNAAQETLRRVAVDYMRDHRSQFSSFSSETVDAEIDRLANNGEWVDNSIIQALANRLQVAINIEVPDQQYNILLAPNVPGPTPEATINLLYVNNNHYMALVPVHPAGANSILKRRLNHEEEGISKKLRLEDSQQQQDLYAERFDVTQDVASNVSNMHTRLNSEGGNIVTIALQDDWDFTEHLSVLDYM